MKTLKTLLSKYLSLIPFILAPVVVSAAMPGVPADIDHGPFDELLQKYVDKKGRVDYAGWHGSSEDMKKLKSYLKQYAPEPGEAAKGDEKTASLINAYNAFTIELILDNFPTESIRKLDDPFEGERHRVGGDLISVDNIEHDMLRPEIGWKVHSVVVCAARSCPPLLDRAYYADDWEEKMKERYRVWLNRPDLNEYNPAKKRVRLSKIFDWYSEDFEGAHSVKAILGRFGPERHRGFLQSKDYKIKFLDYHWGLNAQSDLGEDYKHSLIRSLFG